MRLMAICLASALAASSFTIWMCGDSSTITAQDNVRSGPRGPVFPLVPQQNRATEVPAVFNEEGLTPDETVNVHVYEATNRSVVNITTHGSRPDGFFLLEVPSEGAGSGSVIDQSGHILTNFHVVEDAKQVEVTLFDGKSYEAHFVGADPINDVAILKIDAPQEVLFPVHIGDSSKLRVGMRVFAIGNPFGLERTLTTGIISSLNRSLSIRANRTIKSIIQIDAAINPGNSGGPLLDSHARMIGMNTAIASKTGQSSGVGFAIPVNLISRVVPQLIQHGRVIRPEIGIQRVYETEQGLLVARVTPGGPADAAGIRGPRVARYRRGPFIVEKVDRTTADVITAVDGKEAKTADDFLAYIESRKPGDTVTVTVLRENQRLDIRVTLGGGPQPEPIKPDA